MRGKRNSNGLNTIVFLFLIFILALKNIIVAYVRGWSIDFKTALVLAGIDVFFMLVIAYVMTSTHGAVSTAMDGD